MNKKHSKNSLLHLKQCFTKKQFTCHLVPLLLLLLMMSDLLQVFVAFTFFFLFFTFMPLQVLTSLLCLWHNKEPRELPTERSREVRCMGIYFHPKSSLSVSCNVGQLSSPARRTQWSPFQVGRSPKDITWSSLWIFRLSLSGPSGDQRNNIVGNFSRI